jgi:CubicO group peptidase (beta-lactamase class C family)
LANFRIYGKVVSLEGKNFMYLKLTTLAFVLSLTGCAETSVQPLTQTSFKISTATSDCGRQGARDVAFMAAAIEVIKGGGDRFIIVGDQSASQVAGGFFTGYGGFQTYSNDMQDLVVQLVQKGDPNYNNALSARQTLGADWSAIVAKGIPQTCT